MCPDGLIVDTQSDNDSLYVMPLDIIPFESQQLGRGRLRMNGALEHVVDMFTDGRGAHGFLQLDEITQKFGAQNYGWDAEGPLHPDLALLRKLKNLSSFDVYSLRILFRQNGITPKAADALDLSASTKASLSAHLKRFTAPLILNVYGDVAALGNADDPIELFRHPDRDAAARNLQKLADSLQVPITGIPEFLEAFSECYLSISYFERYLHAIYPEITTVVEELNQLKQNRSLSDQPTLQNTCDAVSEELTSLILSTLGKIERFHKETETLWQDLTAERFYRVSELVTNYQISVAGVLCGLGIKMSAWRTKFATADSGGPFARGDFLMSNLLPGIDQLKKDRQCDLSPWLFRPHGVKNFARHSPAERSAA